MGSDAKPAQRRAAGWAGAIVVSATRVHTSTHYIQSCLSQVLQLGYKCVTMRRTVGERTYPGWSFDRRREGEAWLISRSADGVRTTAFGKQDSLILA